MITVIQETNRSIFLVILWTAIIFLNISCETDINSVDTNDDQLPLIGIWDWLYSQDAKTNELYNPDTENYTHHLMFSGDSIVLFYYNDTLDRQCKYNITAIYLENGTVQTFLEMCNQSPSPMVYEDTLRLIYASTDGNIDYYLRRNIP